MERFSLKGNEEDIYRKEKRFGVLLEKEKLQRYKLKKMLYFDFY